MTHPDPVRQGVLLALTAEQLGLLDEHGLSLVLAYYERQGRRGSLSPDQVLTQLGGLSLDALTQARSAPPVNVSLGSHPFAERLQLLGTLGEGGMGAVYRAYDKLLRRVVALKLIRPERLGVNAPRVLQRFEREAQVMARVRHPNCVAIHSAGQLRGQPFLVMEYVRGETLMQRIEREGPLDPRRVAEWGRDLALGLESCHGVGVVHRDVKPANVLLDGEGCPRLTDFGIARDTDARTKLTAEAAAIGTLAYMPPEQALGRPADPRADVYSLGASLFEALTGELVFTADQPLMLLHQISTDRARSVRGVREEVPLDLSRVVGKCLEKDPDDRYPSASALAADLSAFLAGQPVHARPLSWAGRALRIARRRRRLLSGALVATAALALLAWGGSAANAAGQRRRERAELARASGLEDPSAAVAALTSLAATASVEVALEAREAIDPARHRQSLAEAEAALAKLTTCFDRRATIGREKSALEAGGVDQLPLKSAEKQRYLELRAQAEEAAAEQQEWSQRARLALRRADELLEGSEPAAQAWARLLVLEAEHAPDVDRAAALREQATQRLLGVGAELPGELGTPRVRLAVAGGAASAVLRRLVREPSAGRWLPHDMGPFVLNAATGLPVGRYLAEVTWDEAPGQTVAVPFLARRGPLQQLALPRPALLDRRWAWAEFAYVLPGRTYGSSGGDSLSFEVPVDVGEFYAGRTENPLEAWYSYRCALGWPSAEAVPTGNLAAPATGPLPPGTARLPTGRVTEAEVGAYLGWLRNEVIRARLPLLLGLPVAKDYARALRGPFRWAFPWGEHFDSSFVSKGDLLPVGSGVHDRSVFAVLDLVSSVAELGRGPRRVEGSFQVSFGGTSVDTWSSVGLYVSRTAVIELNQRKKYVGFRVYAKECLLPELTRDPVACAAKRAEAIRLGGLTDYLGAVREATAAIDADPLDLQAWLIRGTAKLRLSDNWGANFDGWRAVELEPESVDGWSLIGIAQHQRGMHASALEAWDRALKLRPRMADSYRMRAHVKAELGDAPGALEDLDQYERLAPAQHPMRADADALRAKLGD